MASIDTGLETVPTFISSPSIDSRGSILLTQIFFFFFFL
jgi:hypothetical protein